MDNLKKVLTNRQELSGSLYKYTNVVKGERKFTPNRSLLMSTNVQFVGFQLRFCRVDAENGILSYYLVDSGEDQFNGNPPRGQVYLMGALINPSDEDSRTFTINPAAGETIKLKANDARSRQEVIRLQLHIRVIPISFLSCFRFSVGWRSSCCRWELVHARKISTSSAWAPGRLWLPHSVPKAITRHWNVQRKTMPDDWRLPRWPDESQRPRYAASQSALIGQHVHALRRLGAFTEISRI